jgi:hypothetical protein
MVRAQTIVSNLGYLGIKIRLVVRAGLPTVGRVSQDVASHTVACLACSAWHQNQARFGTVILWLGDMGPYGDSLFSSSFLSLSLDSP